MKKSIFKNYIREKMLEKIQNIVEEKEQISDSKILIKFAVF